MNRAPLDVARLRRGLPFFSRIDVVESTGSTNADLLDLAADPELDRVVLLAEHQRSGRGRHQRVWVSPPHAQLALSVLLRLSDVAPAALGWLSLLTGVAVVDALVETAAVPAVLKWPNDVLIAEGGERRAGKVAGILAEVAPATGALPLGVVVGVGLNVSLDSAELPVPQATSLALAGARELDRTVLAESLLARFADRITQWHENDWDTAAIAEDYRARCVTLGNRVRAELPGGETLTGAAVDVDADGRLRIRLDAGNEIAVSAGDVTHLRPS
jgi:BirA family biotin operon repressor/biotin-[acetyl-CoA-carboxylase] ligase